MGAISFGEEGASWVAARWAFRGYLEHVLNEVHTDATLADAIEEALALDGLHLHLTSPTVVERLMPVLLRVADEVLSGARPVCVEGAVLDDASQEQFRSAVRKLRAMLARRPVS